jgi:hypothetical protein
MAFLAMAVLVHAGLLLIPLNKWQAAIVSPDDRLTIKLQALPAPAKTEPFVDVEPRSKPPEPAESKRDLAPVVLEEIPVPMELVEQQPTQAKEEEINAQRLRSLITKPGLLPMEPEASRQLGDAKEYRAPANWSRDAGAPYLSEFDNRFNGMTVPEKVEIVDRWLAADGSHNVVLNTPTGETFCGRAEAYNPMQPLVEPIMMFHPCGGGGKRTFSMPERYNKGR